ncbi:MAG: DUF3429 domain-containing protein [Rhodobacteraceae bacterium]|nr:DUF3429 domain-containing protein [Paracoccaceae bacterium]
MLDKKIPAAALVLGLAGVIPFFWGVGTILSPALRHLGLGLMPPMFLGPVVGISYGTVILSFMSGVLWGFATRDQGRGAAIGYVLSVIPALWVFFMVQDATEASQIYLIAGFLGLLGLDYSFANRGLAPAWWMRLRLLLTVLVVGCLAVPLVV